MTDEQKLEPVIDDELIVYIVEVWDKYCKTLTGYEYVENEMMLRHVERLAAYLTIAHFVAGGKMPEHKFNPDEVYQKIVQARIQEKISKLSGESSDDDS